MQIEVVLAWPERFVSKRLDLPEGATVADALAAAALPEATPDMACAVYGDIAAPTRLLQEGDRVELLRPLLIDPKDARRRRAKPR